MKLNLLKHGLPWTPQPNVLRVAEVLSPGTELTRTEIAKTVYGCAVGGNARVASALSRVK